MAPELSARARFCERISADDPSLRLYAILDAEVCNQRGRALMDVASAWRDAGVALVQYRDKLGSPAQILRNALSLREVFAGTDCFLILNDSVDLAMQAGFDGVHLGQGDGETGSARSALGPDRILGRSTHTVAQVRKADTPDVDYLAIGPVFPTSTKTDADPVLGLDGLQTVRAVSRKPLVAIGGITLSLAPAVRAVGADSVAAISALLPPSAFLSFTRLAQDFLAALK